MGKPTLRISSPRRHLRAILRNPGMRKVKISTTDFAGKLDVFQTRQTDLRKIDPPAGRQEAR
jgi:hypothetical protein